MSAARKTAGPASGKLGKAAVVAEQPDEQREALRHLARQLVDAVASGGPVHSCTLPAAVGHEWARNLASRRGCAFVTYPHGAGVNAVGYHLARREPTPARARDAEDLTDPTVAAGASA